MATDPLVPINTPFSYNIGINYETWENGRTGYSITADLDQITRYFGLIKTFHDVAVGTANPNNPIIDPTQQQVISYVARTSNVQLAMGTLNNALFQGGFGQPWAPGLMTSSTYTDKWVQMIINSFGSVQKTQAHLKIILLGNEIDKNGPPPNDRSFGAYQGWIKQSFDNLAASLKKYGLASIPVSTTIANYGVSNAVAVNISAYIQSHWSKAWDGGRPIVFYNQYTQATARGPASSTDFNPVINYFQSVYTQLRGKVEPFIGETGYSTFYGQPDQVRVYNQISAWLNGQHTNQGRTIPLFAFDAFDQPSREPPFEVQFGIFAQNASHRPTGLKPGLTLPSWTKTPISSGGNDRAYLFNGAFSPGMTVDGGAGTDTLVLAEPQTVDLTNSTLVGVEALEGSSGNDTVTITADEFLAFTRIDLGGGADVLKVVVQGAAGLPAGGPALAGIESLDVVHAIRGTSERDFIHRAGDGRIAPAGYNDITGVTTGDDLIKGLEADDIIFGDAGNDKIIGGPGFDHMTGGPGDDLYYVGFATGQALENIGEGFDRVLASVDYILAAGQEIEMLTPDAVGVEPVLGTFAINLTGNEFANRLWGNAAANVLSGMGGDDALYGFDGNDQLYGSDGNDTLKGGAGDDSMNGGAGNDRLLGDAGADQMTGGPGDDLYYVDNAAGQALENIGEGFDRVLASVDYILAAGQEIEMLTTNAAGVAPSLGTDPINLTGNEFAQTIEGNAAANVLNGMGGDDTLNGFDGNDTLIGGPGADFLWGGNGYNYASYATATSGVVVNLLAPSLNTGDAAGDVYWSHAIQGLIGSSFDDVLTSDRRQSEVVTLIGGAGNDTLVDAGLPSPGEVHMAGGTGDDTYYVNTPGQFGVSDDRITENAGEGIDRVITSVDINLRLSNAGQEIEVLETSDINGTSPLTLEGNGFSNTIIGNAGDNFMQGDSGNDTIFGSDGNDSVFGLGGDDFLHGGAGNDRLFGNAGLGDAGQDGFVFDTPLSSTTNVDTIEDFSASENDQIVLDHAIFTTLVAGALPADAFFVGAAATDANDRILYDQGFLSYDPDGSGSAAATRFAQVLGNPTLAASNFTVI